MRWINFYYAIDYNVILDGVSLQLYTSSQKYSNSTLNIFNLDGFEEIFPYSTKWKSTTAIYQDIEELLLDFEFS